MELTKEHFEQHLNTQLKSSEKRIIKRIDGAQEELARMVSGGFEDRQNRLDVKQQIQQFERKFQKLEQALHIKL